jgi:arylsulfatase A-like enzyme
MGAHGLGPWRKKQPYEESLRVPWVMRWPGVLEAGATRDPLVAPVDILPSLCGLFGIPVPRTVEGCDLSDAWRGTEGAFEQDAVLTMDFSADYNYLVEGAEWRGVRGKRYSYARWLDGTVVLFDLENDPLQMRNLANEASSIVLQEQMERKLGDLMDKRRDELIPCSRYRDWFDAYRRVVCNAYGRLGDPEGEPDWSLLS